MQESASQEFNQAASGVVLAEGSVSVVPSAQPALLRARQISDAAVACGFEWDTLDDVWVQVAEEIDELKEAYAAAARLASSCSASDSGQPECANPASDSGQPGWAVTPQAAADALAAVELELGDVLFSLVNVGRKMGVDAEESLHATCRKFSRRWAAMEAAVAARADGACLADLSTDELNELWREAKQGE